MTLPTNKVFETEYEGSTTTIYADEHGLRVSCPAGDLLVVDWHGWLLTAVYAMGYANPLTGPFQAVAVGALAAFPPPIGDGEP